jgi:periplasmic protein TonB
MESKKNPLQDIHRIYPLTLTIGFLLSIGIIITAFELKFKYDPPPITDFTPEDDMVYIQPIVITESQPQIHQRERSLPPKLTQIPAFVEVATSEDEPSADLQLPDLSELEPVSPTIESMPVVSDEPVVFAEEMPLPVGGFEGFYKQLKKELRYPPAAVAGEIQGRVFVEFVVDKEGNATMVKIVKGIGSGCDEEALRVLSKTKWKAGKQGGRAVKVRMILPIHFSLKR